MLGLAGLHHDKLAANSSLPTAGRDAGPINKSLIVALDEQSRAPGDVRPHICTQTSELAESALVITLYIAIINCAGVNRLPQFMEDSVPLWDCCEHM